MPMLRDDRYSRHGEGVRGLGLRPGMLFVLVFVSVALLFLSRLHHRYVDEIRLHLAELLAPAMKAAIVPLDPIRRAGQRLGDYVDLAGEVERLRKENQRLRGWEWRALESERKASQLARLGNAVAEPGLDFVSGRVVADSSGPFVRSAMLAIGREDGARRGFPVVDGDGLVGRIIETGARASRVLLVTDINSRIPVLVGRQAQRAVLQGDNGPAPRLHYLAADAVVSVGDEVYTSGVGGVLPRGLRIGIVIDDAGSFRVQPHARLDELDFVSILQFESPGLDGRDDDTAVKPQRLGERRSAVEPQPATARSRRE